MKKSLFSYFKDCYTVNYANPRGRARRREFWGFQLFYLMIQLILSLVGILLFAPHDDQAWISSVAPTGMAGDLRMMSLMLAFSLISLPPFLTICIRRLHDINRSGWWALAILVMMILWYAMIFFDPTSDSAESLMLMMGTNAILGIVSVALSLTLIIFFLKAGTRGDNRYGPDPKALPSTGAESV
ncbi:MAG: DUF805 domain-containing protein [Porphyromonadaceae bacterium]|nr:DUF805 domain-containing protein [Porphyromonadaceae bacterium]